MSTIVVREESELESVAETLLAELKAREGVHVLALQGDLGAGKTSLTKALARLLGVTEHVTSPTFVIMKSYPLTGDEKFTTLTHVDAYRIEDEDELRILGFETILREPTTLTVIEWPERIPNLVPKVALRVVIEIEEGNGRRITYGG